MILGIRTLMCTKEQKTKIRKGKRACYIPREMAPLVEIGAPLKRE
jgi:hypothetical protein